MPTDSELLHRYATEQAQEAFAEFVERNLGLVYSAALRRTGGCTQVAEEVAQKVFTDASRKAAALARHPALAGWLHQSTRYAATDAMRAEYRRRHLATSFSSMNDDSVRRDTAPDWDKLRPVLDQVIDELGERDRELMLLRHFQGLTHADVGRRLGLTENAARKRADRVLEILRQKLTRRGITSTGAALGLALSEMTLGVAPKGLAAGVTSVALSTPPATGVAGLLVLATMSKFTTPILVAVVTTGLTTAVWSSTHNNLSPAIEAEQAEYGRLKAATAQTASAEALAPLAAEYSRNASLIASTLAEGKRKASTPAAGGAAGAGLDSAEALSPHGYSNLGRVKASDAVITFAWACDVCDPVALGSMVYFDEKTRAHAQRVLDGMPESVKFAYASPEAFYGMLLAAACIEAPPPSAELAKRLMSVVELSEGRVATRSVGSGANHHEFQSTPDGWKYVLPDAALESLPQLLNSPTLAKLRPNP